MAHHMGFDPDTAVALAGHAPVPELPPIALTCPTTGELVACADVDGLVDAYERARVAIKELEAFRYYVQVCLVALDTEKDPAVRTRRVHGERRHVKIELKDPSFDQQALRDIVCKFPVEYTGQFIRVDRYKVMLGKYKQMLHDSGSPAWMVFRQELEAACRGRVGLPTVTIEE